ncbi:glycosyltransferase family 87 protein [Mesorhizobium sp. CAU 1741]|uniref:glycosyltransferase family 87 protein n=1 Tax=Mesorhizobium sp. CAU 1741 TaxID=3140366 RepID=UPI00325BE24D
MRSATPVVRVVIGSQPPGCCQSGSVSRKHPRRNMSSLPSHHVPANLLARWRATPWQTVLCLFVMPMAFSGGLALLLLVVSDPPVVLQDFRDAYYLAGVAVQAGPHGLSPMIARGTDGFVNLPIIAYLFWPLGLLPVFWASVLFSIIGVFCVLAAWWLLVRLAELEAQSAVLLLLVFAINGPMIYGFKEGNVSHILLLMFAIALTWLRRGAEFSAGLLLGFAAVIKPPLLLVGIYFLFRRRWSVVAGGALSCAAAGLLSLAVFGWAMHVSWYELCIKPYSDNPIAAFNSQSVQAFFLRMQVGLDGWFDWSPIPFEPAYWFYSTIVVGGIAAFVVLTLLMPAGRDSGQAHPLALIQVEFMMIVALACVISPISWSHYYTWFLMPFAFFVGRDDPAWSTPILRGAGWLGIVLLSTPVIADIWRSNWASSTYGQIGVSSLLFGGIIWLLLLCRVRYRMASDAHAVADNSF